MEHKVGRNDPCPCGSKKKYKQCCMNKERPSVGPRKFTAKLLSAPKGVNLIERAYGQPALAPEQLERPPEETQTKEKEQL